MSTASRITLVLVAGLITLATNVVAADPLPQFERDIRPILTAHCLKCHGPDKQNAGVDFTPAAEEKSIPRHRKLWRKTLQQVEAEVMPPEEAKPLSTAQRKLLVDWLKGAATQLDCGTGADDPGPAVIRRLNLAEYNRTVRELVGFEFNAAEAVGMADDAANGGYGRLAAGLNLSPALFDKYFAAADKIVDRLLGIELATAYDGDVIERAKRARERLLEPKTADGLDDSQAARVIITRFARRAFRRPVTSLEIDQFIALYDRVRSGSGESSNFEAGLRAMLKAVLVSPYFLFQVEQDRLAAGQSAVRISDHELASRLSYFLWSSMPDEELLDLADRGKLSAPGTSTEFVKFSGNVIGAPGSETQQGNNRSKVFDGDLFSVLDGPNADGVWIGLDLGEARPIHRLRFAGRRSHERRLVGGKFQASHVPDFSSDVTDLLTITEEPKRGWITGEIAAPQAFRYVRYVPPKQSWGNIAEIEVWGPDAGTVLEQQVRRMLADPQARALTDHFAAEWVGLPKLLNARPSTEFFPTFTPKLRQAMHDEVTLFFDQLRKEDRSVLELLDADYTYVNAELAKHYGIPSVEGDAMRRVDLKPEYHRGGMLGMGGILAMTSHTHRTSPTLRGKWILDVVFGLPPPPPPPEAGLLKEETDKSKIKSFRELLAQHAGQASCAACHRKMDPLGFALDNYDAIGTWRDNLGGQALDTSGELPTGQKFQGSSELKQMILQRQDEFLRNLTEQLTIYALGRELDYYDDCTVDRIQQDLKANGYRFSRLVNGIVQSFAFQHRRSRP